MFLATGNFACVVGVEMLLIDSAIVLPIDGRGTPRVFTAPDWAPWSLISAGAVTVLHFCSLSLPGADKAPGGPPAADPRFR